MIVTNEDGVYIAVCQGQKTKGISHADAIKNMLALLSLLKMEDEEFNSFFESLPARVKLAVRGSLVSWKETLPQYFNWANPLKCETQI